MSIADEAQQARDSLELLIVTINSEVAELETTVAARDASITHLNGVIVTLEDRIAELESEPEPEPEPEPTGRFGTHYPADFPAYNSVGVEVDASWAAIRAAIVGGAKVVKVRPGVLPGNGMASSSTRVLENLDGAGALVRPRDGYGSVTIGKDISIRTLSNIAFMGFDGENVGVMIRDCANVVWGWSEMKKIKVYDSPKVRLIEWVAREVTVEGDDRLDIWPVGGDSGYTEILGCYIAPIYRPVGSGAHTDLIQIERVNGGTLTGPFVLRDSIGFGASNQGFMFATVPNVTLDNFVLVGGRANEGRYPRPASADMPESEPRAMNGVATVTLQGSNRSYGIITSGYTFSGPGTLDKLPGAAPSTAVDTWLDQNYPKPTKAQLVAAWS